MRGSTAIDPSRRAPVRRTPQIPEPRQEAPSWGTSSDRSSRSLSPSVTGERDRSLHSPFPHLLRFCPYFHLAVPGRLQSVYPTGWPTTGALQLLCHVRRRSRIPVTRLCVAIRPSVVTACPKRSAISRETPRSVRPQCL